MSFEQESRLKVIVVGAASVGKTSLLARYTQDTFAYNYKATIGCDFVLKELLPRRTDKDGKLPKLTDKSQAYHSEIPHKVQLQLWDLPGQDHYAEAVPALFCRNAVGVLMVCDETSAESVEKIRLYKQSVNKHATIPGSDGKSVPCVLAVNKHDLVVDPKTPMKAAMSPEEITALTEELQIDEWFYSSAKTGEGVAAPFDTLVTRYFADSSLVDNETLKKTTTSQTLRTQGRKTTKKKSECPCQN